MIYDLLDINNLEDADGPYRGFTIAAWDTLKDRGNQVGIEREVNGRLIRAKIFNNFKMRYNVGEDSEARGCIDRFLRRAYLKGFHGDLRGTTLNLQVSADGDDGYDDGTTWNKFATPILVGHSGPVPADGLLRFTGLTGISGTVNSADLSTHGASGGKNGTPAMTIYCDDTSGSPAAPTNHSEFTSLTNSTASLGFSGAYSPSVFNDIGDIKDIIQELVDDYTVTAVIVLLRDNASAGGNYFEVSDYGQSSANAAKLDIDYTGVAPAGNRMKTLLVP